MEKTTMRIGLILSLVGIIAFVGTRASSLTALIPTLFGVLLVLAGYLGQRASFYPAALYGAATLSLLGLLGSTSPCSYRVLRPAFMPSSPRGSWPSSVVCLWCCMAKPCSRRAAMMLRAPCQRGNACLKPAASHLIGHRVRCTGVRWYGFLQLYGIARQALIE